MSERDTSKRVARAKKGEEKREEGATGVDSDSGRSGVCGQRMNDLG